MTFLGFVKFGVDDGCPCSAPGASVVVRAHKEHQGWQGYDSSSGTFAAYLTGTPSGDLFGADTAARTLDRLTGVCSGSQLNLNPGGGKTGSSTYQSGQFSLTETDPPYDTLTGSIALSSAYAFGQIKSDADVILANSVAHPAAQADGTFNLARRAELATDTDGEAPESAGLTVRYFERRRFSGQSGHVTWWDGSSTVDGAVSISDETDPFQDFYSADHDRNEGSHVAYKIVTGWRKGKHYYRERAFIPCSGYYSAQVYVTVEDGLGGETLLAAGSRAYFYHSGAYIDVRSPHLDAAYEDSGAYGSGLDTYREVKAYLWIRFSDVPPEGTTYTNSSTAGQSEGC